MNNNPNSWRRLSERDSCQSDYSQASFEKSAFKKYLPEGTNVKEKDLTNLELLCYTALIHEEVGESRLYSSPCPHANSFREKFRVEADWFSISNDPETRKWFWSVIVPNDDRPQGLTNQEFQYRGLKTEFEMTRLRHHLIASCLTAEETDIKLGSIFPYSDLSEDDKNRTPDIRVKLNGVLYIIEVGTTDQRGESIPTRMFADKYFRYEGILKEVKHTGPCVFIPIIISPSVVVCGYPLPNRVIRTLLFSMKLCTTYEGILESKGLKKLTISYSTREEAMMESILEQIKSIPVTSEGLDDPLDITPEFIKSLKKPADKAKVLNYFIRELTECTKNSENRDKKEKVDGAIARKEYTDTLRNQDSRVVPKAIVQVPLFLVKRKTEFNNTYVPFPVCQYKGGDCAVIALWQAAGENFSYDANEHFRQNQQRIKEMYEEDPVEQAIIQARNKEQRRKTHRSSVKSKLTREQLHVLAMDGLWAKKLKDDVEKKEKHNESKKPWNFVVDCSDIEEFLSRSDLYGEYDSNSVSPKVLKLIEKSLRSTEQPLDILKDWKTWLSTKMCCSLSIVSDIVHELTISAKQNVKSQEVIIKKLAWYDVYLLIVPTKSSEHIFFSIYVPPQDGLEILSNLPFRRMKPTGEGGFYTDICSFLPDKLKNPATILESFMTNAAFWTHHYGLSTFTPKVFVKSLEAIKMTNMSILITLENKHTTEEALTTTRYMYMEVMKTNTWVKPNPSRLISKLSKKPRSRLELFTIRRILWAFDKMVEEPVRKVERDDTMEVPMDPEEDVPNTDQWAGLINPITMSEEKNGSKVVMLFYLGYSVDKNQVSRENADYQTIEKAIREDRKFNPAEADKSNGKSDDFKETPKDKQFSINVVKYGVELMIRELVRGLGRDYQVTLMNNILRRLSDQMTYDLASVKASANIDHVPWDSLPTADQELRSRKGRLKVIEALMLEIGLFEHNPFMKLSTIVEIIQRTSKGLICDLFKKNQHGGIREIYVLTIKSRILALFIETCARELCSHFEQETMTHPDHKLQVAEGHKTRVASHARSIGCPYAEFHCSADKKSWNNNLVMPVLGIPLFMMLPSCMHGAIQNIMNMWNRRLIKIPTGVLKLLKAGTQLSCSTYQDILKEFDEPGCTGGREMFPSKQSPFAILRTGMMQGILHYTSSLLHVSFLYSTKSIMLAIYEEKFPSVIAYIDQMCSSDDSATIISIIFKDKSEEILNQAVAMFTEVLCQTLTKFCQYSCFTNSEKSTMGAPYQMEFNSEFIIMNTLAVPTYKWLVAAMNVDEAESLMMRSISAYNLMSQVFAAGLPAYFTSIVQLNQAHLHYRLMGANTSSFFDFYSSELDECPDPNLGFFIMDNIRVPGVLGYDYHFWLHSRFFNMFSIKKKNVLDGSLSFTPEGGIIEQFLVHHGDSRRYHKMVELMAGEDSTLTDLRDKVNENFHLLYRPADCMDDAKIKLQAKCLAPGTAQSLSRGVAFLQSVAMSTYMMFGFCFSRYDASFVDGELQRNVSKTSLLAEIRRRKYVREGESLITGPEAEAICFPNHLRYEEYRKILTPYKHAREVVIQPMRNRKSVVHLVRTVTTVPVELTVLVLEKWFGVNNRYSEKNKRKSWDLYKVLMPWLDDDISVTLQQSPFSDHIGLYNFINTASKGYRTFTRVGPAVRASFPHAQINQIARRCYKDGVRLEISKDAQALAHLIYRDRRTSFGLALDIPNNEQREKMVEYAVSCHPIQGEELSVTKGRHRREATLSIMVAVMEGKDNFTVTQAIEAMGNGLFVGWTTMQKKRISVLASGKFVNNWYGKGELTLCNREGACLLLLQDQYVIEINATSARFLQKHHHQIVATIREQGLKIADSPLRDEWGYEITYTHYITSKDVKRSKPGIGVNLESQYFKVVNPDLSDIVFRVDIRMGWLRLLQEGISCLPHCIMDYRTLDHEFCASQSGEVMSEVWIAWYLQAHLKAEVATQLIKETYIRCKLEKEEADASATYKDISKEALETKKFLSSTLKARLRHRSYDIANLPVSFEKKQAPPISQSDGCRDAGLKRLVKRDITSVDMDLFTFIHKSETFRDLESQIEADENAMVKDVLEGTYCMMDFNKFFSEMLIHNPAVDICTNRLTNKYSVLPLWDPFIDGIKKVNPNAWGDIVSGRKAPGVDDDLCKYLGWLLLDTVPSPAMIFGQDPDGADKTEALQAEADRLEAVQAIYSGSTYSRATSVSLADPSIRAELRKLNEKHINKLGLTFLKARDLKLILGAIDEAGCELMERMQKEEEARASRPRTDRKSIVETWVDTDCKTIHKDVLTHQSSPDVETMEIIRMVEEAEEEEMSREEVGDDETDGADSSICKDFFDYSDPEEKEGSIADNGSDFSEDERRQEPIEQRRPVLPAVSSNQSVRFERSLLTPEVKENTRSMLTEDEIHLMWELFKADNPLLDISPVGVKIVMHQLRNKVEYVEAPDITKKFLFFCHMGSVKSGHWVVFASGVGRGSLLEFFDGTNEEHYYETAFDMMKFMYPHLTRSDVHRNRITNQIDGSTCGHICLLYGLYALAGVRPPVGIEARLVTWIEDCLENGIIIYYE